jgi:MoaA/NifB/PqqE/SkfB family radical SAM enzyme
MNYKFHKVHIEISNICNLQCSFCPEVVRTKKLMDLDLFESAVRQAAPLTEQVAFHLMGDPLLHPRLKEMVEICRAYRTPIFFVTNGVLLKAEKAELLLDPAFRQVNFSLHSFHDNFGDKDPTEYLERIFRYTEEAFERRPDLYINYRLWNLQEARGAGAQNRAMLEKIVARFGAEIPGDIDVRRKKSFRLKNRLYLHFDTEFEWPDLHRPVLHTRGHCYGLKSHFGILADGTVVPCCLDKEAGIPLGSLREQPLEAILAGPRAQKLLRGFRDGNLVEDLCRRCQYIERF